MSEMDKDVDFPERCSKCLPWGCEVCPVLQLLATERLVIETQARHIESLERRLGDIVLPDGGDIILPQETLNKPGNRISSREWRNQSQDAYTTFLRTIREEKERREREDERWMNAEEAEAEQTAEGRWEKPEAIPDGILRLRHLPPIERYFDYLTVAVVLTGFAYGIYGLVR